MDENIFGKVVGFENDRVMVKIDFISACSSCPHSKECSIFQKGEQKIILAENPNNYKVEEENLVELFIESKKILFLSFIFYILPLIMIFLFSLIGYILNWKDFLIVLSGFSGFLFSFIFIHLFNRKYKENFNHKIVRVLK